MSNSNKTTGNSFEKFTRLIAEANHVSSADAAGNFNSGKRVSKAGVFILFFWNFCRGFFSGSVSKNNLGRLYSGFYFAVEKFLTDLKLLKLQNKI